MENKLQLKGNIKKNYLYILLGNIDFTRGIWMIYLASKGMSLLQLGLLETIFHITSFIMEVPTGAVADIFGRKVSRILGRISSLISVIILLLADSFYMFAISFVFTALSYNLESGAGDALVYDSLKEIGEENRYMRIAGIKEMIYQTAGIISFLIGGILAARSYSIAFTLTIVVGIITIAQSFRFVEPTVGRVNKEEGSGNIFVRQLKESLRVVLKNPRIGFLILFTESILAFCTCIFFYLQNYLKADGFSESTIGAIYAVSSLGAALIAPQVHRIEKAIKEQGLLMLVPFITTLCVWGVALSPYHYVFFILMMMTEGVLYVAMSDYINKVIPSENRATILSLTSMVFSFFMITLFPLVGLVGDRFSLDMAFKLMAALGSVVTVVNSIILVIKNRRIKT